MELYQIQILVIGVIIAGLYIYKRFTGVDILKNIALLRPVIDAMAAAVAAVYKVLPHKESEDIVEKVAKAAVKGAEMAEAAWKAGKLEKEERNADAKKWIADTLYEAGIEVTDQVHAIIDGAIEATCMILPHEAEDKKESENG